MDEFGGRVPALDLDEYLYRAFARTAFGESLREDMVSRRLLGRYIARHVSLAPVLVLDAGTTSYAITAVLAEENAGLVRSVLTNNLSVALQLSLQNTWTCTLLGGAVDLQHLCTIPDVEAVRLALEDATSTAIVTAAAVKIAQGRIVLRARRPDQFPFKRSVLSLARTPVIAFEAEKLTKPFDGIHELPLEIEGATIVVSGSLQFPEAVSALESACATGGHRLHLVDVA